MYEIIANPEDYGIEELVQSSENNMVSFDHNDRERWASEIDVFVEKLSGLMDNTQRLKELFLSDNRIQGKELSIKALKVQMFLMNDSLQKALERAENIEQGIINK